MLCQVCFHPKRKVRFHTPRLNICQWCITELCSSELTPGKILSSQYRAFESNRRKQLECAILHLERQKKTPPIIPTAELESIHDQSLREISRREGILTYLYRSIVDDSIRQAQARQIAVMRQEQLLASHREAEHRHTIQQYEIESKISLLREELRNVELAARQDLRTYKASVLSPSATRSKEVRFLRAHELGLITTEGEISERPNDYDQIKREIRQEDKYQCAYCGRNGVDIELHVHHIIPVIKSGTYNKQNLVTLCHTCHNRQHPGFQVTKNQPIQHSPRRQRFVAVDIKTTGLSNEDTIIEIGAALFVDGKLSDKFQSLVQTKRLVPHVVTRLTGITQGMIQDAPSADVAFKAFRKFIGRSKLVFHNAAFDMRFLKKYADYFEKPILNSILDTLPIARKKLPGLPSYKLFALRQHLQLTVHQTHRAREGSIATGSLYLQLAKIKSRCR